MYCTLLPPACHYGYAGAGYIITILSDIIIHFEKMFLCCPLPTPWHLEIYFFCHQKEATVPLNLICTWEPRDLNLHVQWASEC